MLGAYFYLIAYRGFISILFHLNTRGSFAFWLVFPGYSHSERWIGTIPEGWFLLTLIMYELESSNNAVDSDSMTAEGVKVIVQGAELVLGRH